MPIELIRPDWPAPPGVVACTTTRSGGCSTGPWASLNLAAHVGDRAAAVAENRRRLRAVLSLPAEPGWLEQVHGTAVADAAQGGGCADAGMATTTDAVCVVLTADCLPVLFCSDDGDRVAAAHAGWRGLANGILEQTVTALGREPGRLLAWLGPAIGPQAFEVGDEVRAAFVDRDPAARQCFVPSPRGRWLADLYALARQRLARVGVGRVWGGGHCTYRDAGRFFSYRRDGNSGRMASLIWLQGQAGRDRT